MVRKRLTTFQIILAVIGILIVLLLGGIFLFLANKESPSDVFSEKSLLQQKAKEAEKIINEGAQNEVELATERESANETNDQEAADEDSNSQADAAQESDSDSEESDSAAEMPPVENNPELCSNGRDDDADSSIDGFDWDCVSVSCPSGGRWTWSYLRTGDRSFIEDASRPPARIGCVGDIQCVNLAGNPVEKDVFYTNKWLCGQSNNFFRCTSADLGATQGTFVCVNDEGTYRWREMENTLGRCSDGIDNDEDGYIDKQDRDCVGVACDSGGILIWSYYPGENQANPPARMSCCQDETMCATEFSECVAFDDVANNENFVYFDGERYVCDSTNNWLLCSNTNAGTESPGGSSICSGETFNWERFDRPVL